MLTLISDLWHDFLHSKEKVTLWARAFVGFVFGILSLVLLSTADASGVPDLAKLRSWGWKGILIRCAVAAVLSLALSFKAGEKNEKKTELPVHPEQPPKV